MGRSLWAILANCVFVQQNITLVASFLTKALRLYSAAPESVDFVEAPSEAQVSWVAFTHLCTILNYLFSLDSTIFYIQFTLSIL